MFQMYVLAPTDGIVLPNPVIGDIRRMDTNAINRTTRGGEHMSFKDTDWPHNELITWDWSLLTIEEIDDLTAFFTTNAGVQIHIIDHNGDEWVGVLLIDILDVRTNKDECSYSTSLDFIGAKV